MNIKHVYNKGMCTQCGTCNGVCNYDSIYIKKLRGFKPHVTSDCTKCTQCKKSCPGEIVDFSKLNKFVFNKPNVNSVYGEVISTNLTKAKNVSLRKNGSSGGAITALLCYLLDKKEIDGTLVVGMDNNKPYCYIARDKKMLAKAQGSKYLPFPINEGLKEIKQRKGKYAVVGLPCHIHGIRKAQIQDPVLKDRIKYCFGLFCGYAMSSLGTRYLFETVGVNEDEVKSVAYRSGEKPNGFVVETYDGKKVKIPKHEYGHITQLFAPKRCTLCVDQTNELSDISFGDPWGVEGGENCTLVLTRTHKGQVLLDKATQYIESKPVSNDAIITSQGAMLVYKKKTVFARMKFLRLFSKQRPFYLGFKKRNNYSNLVYLGTTLLYLNSILMKNDLIRKTVAKMPQSLIKTYCRLVCKLNEDRVYSNRIDLSTF